jgi:chloride channel 3/4/5
MERAFPLECSSRPSQVPFSTRLQTLNSFEISTTIPDSVTLSSVGALVGRMIGFAMEMLQSEVGDTGFFSSCTQTSRCITPGIYAIVGAAAVLGGVTRMTVSMCDV